MTRTFTAAEMEVVAQELAEFADNADILVSPTPMIRTAAAMLPWVIAEVKRLEQQLYGPVSGVQYLNRLDSMLYDRPAGKNIILHASETIETLRQGHAAAGPARCKTCRHFRDTETGFHGEPIGRCNDSDDTVPADGSGFCHLHEEAK